MEINELMWLFDYPLTIMVSFLAFFIPLKKKKNWIVFFIIFVLALFGFWQLKIFSITQENMFISTMMYLVEIGILFLLIIFTIDVDPFSGLFVLVLVYSVQHISYELGLLTITAIDYKLFGHFYYFLTSYSYVLIFSLLTGFILTPRLPQLVSSSSKFMNSVAFVLAIVIEVVLSSIGREIVDYADINNKAISILITSHNIILSLFIASFIVLTAIIKNRNEENIMLSTINEKAKERFNLSKVTIDEINIKYHDLKHMLSNSDLLESDKEEIKKTITNYKSIVRTSNQGLDIIIYETQLRCIKEDIDFNFFVDGDCLKDFKPTHMYTMLSNLLDNSIEALLKVKDHSKRRLSLKINQVRDSIILIIKNYSKDEINFTNGFPKTSKKDSPNHGYGLKSVKNIVDIYHGILSFNKEKDEFVVKIILPVNK